MENTDNKKTLITRMLGPDPPEWFQSDGCTCAPDDWRGIDLRPACRYHDWCYTIWCDISRWRADGYFYINLRELGMPRYAAFWYFCAVRMFGGFVGRWFGSGKTFEKYTGR